MSVIQPSTSTQALVIDLLVQKFQALNLVIDDQPVNVYDGPEGPDQEDNYIVVMGWPSTGEAATSTGQQIWAYLGDRSRYENYDLAIMIFSYTGGIDDTATFGSNDAQALVRANAASLEAQIEHSILADPNLKDQNNGIAPILWILMDQPILTQGFDGNEDDEEGMGSFCQYALRCRVFNLLGGGFTTLP